MTYSYNKLWKISIDHKITKTEMRRQMGITTKMLAKICVALNCWLDDNDIAEITDSTGEVKEV